MKCIKYQIQLHCLQSWITTGQDYRSISIYEILEFVWKIEENDSAATYRFWCKEFSRPNVNSHHKTWNVVKVTVRMQPWQGKFTKWYIILYHWNSHHDNKSRWDPRNRNEKIPHEFSDIKLLHCVSDNWGGTFLQVKIFAINLTNNKGGVLVASHIGSVNFERFCHHHVS